MTETKDMKEEIEDAFLEVLQDIKPDVDEFINRRINHINFARVIFWLSVKSRKEDFFYARELSKFIRLSLGRVHHILNELVENNVLRKRFPTDNLVEFWFVKDNEIPVVQKYFENAKKTLGIKFKLSPEDK